MTAFWRGRFISFVSKHRIDLLASKLWRRQTFPMPAEQQHPFTFAFALGVLYAVAHAALPGWVMDFLPLPHVAVEGSVTARITRAQLKRALLKLATPNVLEGDLSGSPNLLIFNNYTA
ncbi:hypothetical protein FB451DRAFT_1409969 [Mycena latifolia]|nr:hypothetical protein FB451DRAFT_1409969 [Mycena latifolia]